MRVPADWICLGGEGWTIHRARSAEAPQIGLPQGERADDAVPAASARWPIGPARVADMSVTREQLRTTGFAQPVVAMVELLTKPNGRASAEECTARLVQSANPW